MYNFFDPTRVLFGAGQLNHLHEQTMPGKKAMVVISNGKSTRENGSLDRTLNELHQAGVETVLFDKVGANPLKSVVEEGGRFAKDNGCDFVVALGGGSVMDAAKIMAMYALQPGDLWDYVAGATGKMQPLVNPTLPLIATGGKSHESVLETIRAGANAIIWTPPSAQMLQADMMQRYRKLEGEGEHPMPSIDPVSAGEVNPLEARPDIPFPDDIIDNVAVEPEPKPGFRFFFRKRK